MAELDRLIVRIDADIAGLRRDLNRVDQQTLRTGKRLESSFRVADRAALALRRQLLALASGALVTGLIRQGDAYQLLSARLKLVTRDAAEFEAVQRALFNVAQETRQSLTATTTLFTRVARNAAQLNVSASDILDFVRTIQQLTVVSGASAQEAASALIQLSQGLAAGELRGEELRSVMEQLPAVALAAAEGLGLTLGEFRTKSLEGEISSRQFFDAIREGAAKAQQQFQSMPRTAGQALQQLQNSFLRAVGTMNQVEGVSNDVAEAIDGIRVTVESPGFQSAMEGLGFSLSTIFGAVSEGLRLFGELRNTLIDIQEFAVIQDIPPEIAARIRKMREDQVKAAGSVSGLSAGGGAPPRAPNADADEAEAALRRQAEQADLLIQAQARGLGAVNALNDAIETQETLVKLKLVPATASLGDVMETAAEGSDKQVSSIAALTVNLSELRRRLEEVQEARQIVNEAEELRLRLKFADQESEELRVQIRLLEIKNRLGEEAAQSLEAQVRLTEKLRKEQEKTEEKADDLKSAADDLGFTFQSAFEGAVLQGEGFREVLAGIVEDIGRIILRLTVTAPLAKQVADIVNSIGGGGGGGGFLDFIVQGIGGLFTGGAGGGVSAAGGAGGFKFSGAAGLHSGGVAGMNQSFSRQVSPAIFNGAQHFATGGIAGLRNNEVPAILHRGETIRTPAQEAALGARGRSGSQFFIDARGADRQGLRELRAMIERVNGSIELRAVNAVSAVRRRAPGGQFG